MAKKPKPGAPKRPLLKPYLRPPDTQTYALKLLEWQDSTTAQQQFDRLHRVLQESVARGSPLLRRLASMGDQDGRRVVFLVAQAIGESILRPVWAKHKEARKYLSSKGAKALRLAAECFSELGHLDDQLSLMCTLVGDQETAQQIKHCAEGKTNTAATLRDRADGLEHEAADSSAAYGGPLRRLGTAASVGKKRVNTYEAFLLQHFFGFSNDELALLAQAAYDAWKGEEVHIDPKLLSKAIDRYRKRHPEIF